MILLKLCKGTINMALSKSLTINGSTYEVESLSEAAQMQVANIEGADVEIARLQRQLALMQTARNAYVAALSTELGSGEPSASQQNEVETPKKTRKPRAKA